MVGRFIVELAMLKAQAVVLTHVLVRPGCHLRTGFRHAGHLFHGVERIQVPRAGVSRRCQLHCQEGYDEETGYPKPAVE